MSVNAVASLLSSVKFPGRSSLYLHEVSGALSVSIRQVGRYVKTKKVVAIRVSTGNARDHYRIPVAEYDKLVLKRATKLNSNGHSKSGNGREA